MTRLSVTQRGLSEPQVLRHSFDEYYKRLKASGLPSSHSSIWLVTCLAVTHLIRINLIVLQSEGQDFLSWIPQHLFEYICMLSRAMNARHARYDLKS